MKANAVKSFGEYKPLIVHQDGRREICDKNACIEYVQQQTVFYGGPSEIIHYKRGKTFKTREEAIARAQKHIDARRTALLASWQKYNERQIANGLPPRDLSSLEFT